MSAANTGDIVLFETTIDPGLRRVYAAIDYAANQAMVEIAERALDAYPRIWGRRACEKPLYLRAYERQNEARHCIDLLVVQISRIVEVQRPQRLFLGGLLQPHLLQAILHIQDLWGLYHIHNMSNHL